MRKIDDLGDHDWPLTLPQLGLAYGLFSKVLYESPSLNFIGGLANDDLFSEWPPDDENARQIPRLILSGE